MPWKCRSRSSGVGAYHPSAAQIEGHPIRPEVEVQRRPILTDDAQLDGERLGESDGLGFVETKELGLVRRGSSKGRVGLRLVPLPIELIDHSPILARTLSD